MCGVGVTFSWHSRSLLITPHSPHCSCLPSTHQPHCVSALVLHQLIARSLSLLPVSVLCFQHLTCIYPVCLLLGVFPLPNPVSCFLLLCLLWLSSAPCFCPLSRQHRALAPVSQLPTQAPSGLHSQALIAFKCPVFGYTLTML